MDIMFVMIIVEIQFIEAQNSSFILCNKCYFKSCNFLFTYVYVQCI